MNEKLDELSRKVESLEQRVAYLETISKAGQPNPMNIQLEAKKTSLSEFLILKKPGDDVKRTLAIGYYLEKYEGHQSFNIQELEKTFERAKEKKPLNVNDKVNLNIKNGHMDEVREKKNNRKAWHLTRSGEEFVAKNFGVKG